MKNYLTYDSEAFELSTGQKFGLDVVIFLDDTVSESETDLLLFEQTTSIESYKLCLAIPRADYVPQSLVIFESFLPIIWFLILVTIAMFVAVQYVYFKMQLTAFRHFYSEAYLESIESTSTLLTVYAYFLCGCPPRLLLGKLFTGKLIFLVFSFASIILVTAFQDSMYTLLSHYKRYADINTLGEFASSDFFIQVPDIELLLGLFGYEPQFAMR